MYYFYICEEAMDFKTDAMPIGLNQLKFTFFFLFMTFLDEAQQSVCVFGHLGSF